MQEKLHDKSYANELIQKAFEDFEAAKVLHKSTKDLYATAAFHAQQCVEKSIKAVLVACEIPFAYEDASAVFLSSCFHSINFKQFR